MNGDAFDMAGAWHVATAWIDKEFHRWGACLLIVIAIHISLIAGFEAWKAVDHTESLAGAMMIDLGPLPGIRGHGTGNQPATKSVEATAKPLIRVDAKKHDRVRPLVKLRAKVERLFKPDPKRTEHITVPLAATPPKSPSSALVATASAATTTAVDNAGSRAGGSAGSPGGCCGGENAGGPVGFGQGGPVTWQGLLLAQLEAHKRYPLAARERGEQGVAYLRFAMDRQGRVISFSLEQSSGFDDLDRETLDLIQRSQPLPPPPASIAGNVIELVVPVQFELRQGD